VKTTHSTSTLDLAGNIALIFVNIVLDAGIINKILLSKLLAMVVKRFPRVIVLVPVSLLFIFATPAQVQTISGVTIDQNENSLAEAAIKTTGIGFYLHATQS
jgi:hypothetical protein